MTDSSPWTIVLAAGDGTRLAGLTCRRDGRAAPKQFCSLRGGGSLLHDALERAARIGTRERTVVVVAEHHREFWETELAFLPRSNVVVQPRNRGTAAGVLLPLMAILQRDHAAHVAVLPSDHFVSAEAVLADAVLQALAASRGSAASAVLVGIAPDAPDSEYGWIVPGEADGSVQRVERFVEKPEPSLARALFERGALWNSFLFATRGLALAGLFAERFPELFEALEQVFDGPTSRRERTLNEVYERIPTQDFSRDLLQPTSERLRVLRAPPCGWTDLGTPTRVIECLRSLPARARESPQRGVLDLSQRVAALA